MAPDSNLAKKRTGMLVSRWSQHAGGPPGRSSVPQWPRGQDDEVTSALFSDHRLHRIISRGLRGSKGGRAERAHQTPPQCTGNLNSGGKRWKFHSVYTMHVAEGCRYQALTTVLLEPLQSAYVRARAVSHVRGADTPSRRVVAQEGSSRSQSARSSGYTASCTEILQCSGVAATVLTANPPGLIRPALCAAGRQTD